MHATTEQLLSLRDGEPVTAAVVRHARDCPACRDRLDEMILTRDQLTRMPVQGPGVDLWPEIVSRMELAGRNERRRRRYLQYAGLGIAATVFLAAVLIFKLPGDRDAQFRQLENPVATGDTGAPVTGAMPAAGGAVTAQPAPGSITFTDDVDALMARSMSLENTLRALPRRPRVTRARTADLITGLQDGVAMIDYQLTATDDSLSPVQAQQLWRQRVDFLNSLVKVRYAESRQVAYNPK